MARVWVKPFTRADGVKVKGYWRETSAPPAQRSTKVNVMKNDSARASSALSRQTRIPGDKLMKTRRAQKGKARIARESSAFSWKIRTPGDKVWG